MGAFINTNQLQKLLKCPGHLNSFYIEVENTKGGHKYTLGHCSNIFSRIWVFIKFLFHPKNYYLGKEGITNFTATHHTNPACFCSDKTAQAVRHILSSNRKVDPIAIRNMDGSIPFVNDRGPFYHATKSENALKQIILDGGVKVMHKGAYKGAFVAKVPEYRNYGDYVLVFYDALRTHKDNTPRAQLKVLDQGFARNSDGLAINNTWIGFDHRLPTNQRYLAGIILNIEDPAESTMNTIMNAIYSFTGGIIPQSPAAETTRKRLKKDLQNFTGRKITVELASKLNKLRPSVIAQHSYAHF